jgi:glycerol-3-phosphate dehydrogenase
LIGRNIELACSREFDVAVVGGGILGAAVLREAATRGLSACLCEEADFGSGTTWNSLRILHGGLRYLQTMDLLRFTRSVHARRLLALHFPSLIRPVEFTMPLSGIGLHKPSLLRLALAANEALSARANAGVDPRVRLPPGRMLNRDETRQRLAVSRADQWCGAACWSELVLQSPERVVIELLHDACRYGATALNYARVTKVAERGGRVTGLEIRDRVANAVGGIRAATVIICAGARVDDIPLDGPRQQTRRFLPSLAFNLLLDTRFESPAALAVSAAEPGSPVLFLVPQASGLLAGTMHVPRPAGTVTAAPSSAEIESFLAMLNSALPELVVTRASVRQVYAGLLPVKTSEGIDLVARDVVEDLGRRGGPRRCFVAYATKLTTALLTAKRIIDRIDGPARQSVGAAPLPLSPHTERLLSPELILDLNEDEAGAWLRDVARSESVVYLNDLVQRRASWRGESQQAQDFRALCSRALGLTEGQ